MTDHVMSDLPIYGIERLRALLDRSAVIDAVRNGCVLHAAGAVQAPLPSHLSFPGHNGHCHVKIGHLRGQPCAVVKVATGFASRLDRRVTVNDGVVLLLDATSGAPRLLFRDGGWLTAWRTAAATALAAQSLSPSAAPQVGIIGTGLQARLAAEWIAVLMPRARLLLTGRDPPRARQAAADAGAEWATSIDQLLVVSDIVVTATSSTSPLFECDAVRPGTHIVALGADEEGKQELPPALFGRAAMIVTDDRRQCLAFGDFGHAVRAGVVDGDSDVAFGTLLAAPASIVRKAGDVTIVDLTGLAAQDIAIADWFLEQLGR